MRILLYNTLKRTALAFGQKRASNLISCGSNTKKKIALTSVYK